MNANRIGRASTEVPQFPVIDLVTGHRALVVNLLSHLQGEAFDAYRRDVNVVSTEAEDVIYMGFLWDDEHFDFQGILFEYPVVDYAA